MCEPVDRYVDAHGTIRRKGDAAFLGYIDSRGKAIVNLLINLAVPRKKR